MRSRQRGATALGLLSIVAVLGFGVYGLIRLFPLYMEYMAVVRALEQTAEESSGSVTSQQSLRTSLIRRWTIEDITSLEPKDVEIKKTGSGFTMRAWYRAERPFVANVSLAVDFDKTVDVKGP
jgi:ribonuclease HI